MAYRGENIISGICVYGQREIGRPVSGAPKGDRPDKTARYGERNRAAVRRGNRAP